jgi:hypothetical protein
MATIVEITKILAHGGLMGWALLILTWGWSLLALVLFYFLARAAIHRARRHMYEQELLCRLVQEELGEVDGSARPGLPRSRDELLNRLPRDASSSGDG